MKRFLKNYRFPLILLISIFFGSMIGVIWKEEAVVLKPLGDIFLNMMYTLVVPLVFFTISSSVASMMDLKRLGKILRTVFGIFIITSIIAALVMLITLIFIDPIGGANIPIPVGSEIEKVSILNEIVKSITVTDFSLLLSRSNMLPLIIFSVLLGIGVSLIGEKGKNIAAGLSSLSDAMMKVVKIVMYYAPIGLCAYFASLIGEFGPELLGSYARSMMIYYILTIVYFLVFYTIYCYIAGGKKAVNIFYKNIFAPVVTSLATQSSLATLPTNLNAAKDMNIPKDVREVILPIGATMHMEGSSMGSILKIVFLFGIFGKNFTGLDTYLIALLVAVLSAVVMAGIPGGGLIGEMLVVSLYGFPLAAFPLIATIGWLIDPPATMLNACGDSISAMLTTRVIEGKNWLKKKFE